MAEMKRIRKKKIEKVETDIAWAVSQRDTCTDSNLVLRYDEKVCYLQVELDDVFANLNRASKNFNSAKKYFYSGKSSHYFLRNKFFWKNSVKN